MVRVQADSLILPPMQVGERRNGRLQCGVYR